MRNSIVTLVLAAILTVYQAGSVSAQECSIPIGEFAEMRYTKNLDKALGRVSFESDRELGMDAEAARVGYVIGRQALQIGDDPARNEWFTCAREIHHIMFTLSEMADVQDSMAVSAQFQRGLLGLLSDEELLDINIDPEKPVLSVFAADWSGVFKVHAEAATIQRFELETQLKFDPESTPATVTMFGSDGTTAIYPVQIDGDVANFEFLLQGTYRYVWRVVPDEDGCTGGIVTYGTGQPVTWGFTTCSRIQ